MLHQVLLAAPVSNKRDLTRRDVFFHSLGDSFTHEAFLQTFLVLENTSKDTRSLDR